jgi:hypothetical protein
MPSLTLRLVAFTAVVSGLLFAVGGPSAEGVTFGFQTPTGNIHCMYEAPSGSNGGAIRCEVASYSGKRPTKPSSCEFDWAPGAYLPSNSKAQVFLCISDTVRDERNPTLEYGSTWKRGTFVCSIAQSGVTCRNAKKSGFFVSKGSIKRV